MMRIRPRRRAPRTTPLLRTTAAVSPTLLESLEPRCLLSATVVHVDAPQPKTTHYAGGFAALQNPADNSFYHGLSQGVDQFSFPVIFDSGASGNLLSNSTYTTLGVPLTGETYDDVGIGGAETFDVTQQTRLELAPLSVGVGGADDQANYANAGLFKFQAKRPVDVGNIDLGNLGGLLGGLGSGDLGSLLGDLGLGDLGDLGGLLGGDSTGFSLSDLSDLLSQLGLGDLSSLFGQLSFFPDIVGTPFLQNQIMHVQPNVAGFDGLADSGVNLMSTEFLGAMPTDLPDQGVFTIPFQFMDVVDHTGGGPPVTTAANPFITGVTITDHRTPDNHILTPQTFLLDTGAASTIISRAYATQIGINLGTETPVTTIQTLGVGSNIVTFDGFMVDHLNIPLAGGDTLSYDNTIVFVPEGSDLPAGLTGIFGVNNMAPGFTDQDALGQPVGEQPSRYSDWYFDGPGQKLVLVDPTSDFVPSDGGVGTPPPANTISLGGTVTGNIGNDDQTVVGNSDVDLWQFTAPNTETVDITATPAGGTTDPFLRVFDSSGKELKYNDNFAAGSKMAGLSVKVTAGQTYWIGVDGAGVNARKYDGLTGNNAGAANASSLGDYTLKVASEPTVSIADAATTEGTGGTKQITFGVTLSAPSILPVAVKYATVNLTATAPSDFAAANTTLTIPAGQVNANININLVTDKTPELDEYMRVVLFSPTRATIADGVALGTIQNDDLPTVTISASKPTANETKPDTTGMGQFKVTRTDGPTDMPLVVTFTVSGTATESNDYVELERTVTIEPGQKSATIDLTPIDDALAEAPETVTLKLVNGVDYKMSPTASMQAATVTINDNEPNVTVSAFKGSASEVHPTTTGKGTFRFTRAGNTVGDLTVHYIVSNSSTATAGTDYTTLSGVVTIPDGKPFIDVDVIPHADLVDEASETVIVMLDPSDTNYHTMNTGKTATVTIANQAAIDLAAANVAYIAGSYSIAAKSLGLHITGNDSNLGPHAAGAYTIQFRLSTDTVWGNADDIILGSIMRTSQLGNASGNFTFDPVWNSLAKKPAAGSYHVLVRVDANGQVSEVSEDNNTFVSPNADVVITA